MNPKMTVNSLRALATICCGEMNKRPLVLPPLESSSESELRYLTPNSLNSTHCTVYPGGKTGSAADLMSIGDLKIDEKLMMQRELSEAFQAFHKMYYMDKFTCLWGELPTVERLQEGDLVFLKD